MITIILIVWIILGYVAIQAQRAIKQYQHNRANELESLRKQVASLKQNNALLQTGLIKQDRNGQFKFEFAETKAKTSLIAPVWFFDSKMGYHKVTSQDWQDYNRGFTPVKRNNQFIWTDKPQSSDQKVKLVGANHAH